jgi:hypothetical protein
LREQVDHATFESAIRPEDHAFRFSCPICAKTRRLEFTPAPGYYVLCAACLGIIVIERDNACHCDGLRARAMSESDLEHMPSDVLVRILEAKSWRLRCRIEAGEHVYVHRR